MSGERWAVGGGRWVTCCAPLVDGVTQPVTRHGWRLVGDLPESVVRQRETRTRRLPGSRKLLLEEGGHSPLLVLHHAPHDAPVLRIHQVGGFVELSVELLDEVRGHIAHLLQQRTAHVDVSVLHSSLRACFSRRINPWPNRRLNVPLSARITSSATSICCIASAFAAPTSFSAFRSLPNRVGVRQSSDNVGGGW